MKKALQRHGALDSITTDGLRSYGAEMTELGNCVKREVGRWPTIGLRTVIFRCRDASELCSGSDN